MSNKDKSAAANKRRNDVFMLVGIILIISVVALIYFLTRKEGSYASVIKDGTEIARYSLSEDCTVPITNGDKVTNILVIKDGKAYISEADCPDQICVRHSAVFNTGETIVCLPNKLVIKISASDNADAPDLVV